MRTAYIILLYVALSFMLAVLTRSTAAVTGSLIFLLVIETVLNVALPILGKPSAQIAQYLPTNLATVIGNQNAAIAKLPIPAASALAPACGSPLSASRATRCSSATLHCGPSGARICRINPLGKLFYRQESHYLVSCLLQPTT